LLVGTYNVGPTFDEVVKTSGLIAGRIYRFVSTATNEIGESLFSNEARFASALLPSKPS
jgi:hypothetical protein